MSTEGDVFKLAEKRGVTIHGLQQLVDEGWPVTEILHVLRGMDQRRAPEPIRNALAYLEGGLRRRRRHRQTGGIANF